MQAGEQAPSKEELRIIAGSFASVLNSQAYALWASAMQGQRDRRTQEVMTPASDDKSVLQAEFAKGEAYGIDLALKMFSTLAEQYQQDLDTHHTTGDNHA